MPKLPSTLPPSHHHFIPQPTPQEFTGGSTYQKPLVAAVRVLSLDKTTSVYNFNPFTHSGSNGVTYCSVQLGINSHGTFTIEIENTDNNLNTDDISMGKRVQIWIGKTLSTMTLILSGMIREVGFTRGCENNLLYSISGAGTGIRFNERTLDITDNAAKTLDDGVTLDPSNSNFQADNLIDNSIEDADFYPLNIHQTMVEGADPTGFHYINSLGFQRKSKIHDFIPSIQARYIEISDFHNQIEDFTGARVWVDQHDAVQFDAVLTPETANSGFIITTTQDYDNDLADNTCYVSSDSYTWSDSIDKGAGFSNGLYGLLPPDPTPDKDSSEADDYYENKTVEIAQRFKMSTNPNWRIWAGVEAIGMSNTTSENSVRTRWRLCKDDNGKPKNSDGIIESRYMYPNKHYSTSDAGLQVIQISKDNPSADLDENAWYWLILTSVNATSTEYWRWYHNNSSTAGVSATASPGTSSDSNGGSGWTVSNKGPLMVFSTGRFKTEPYYIADQKSMDERILIESVIPSFPQQINTKQAAVKYMVGLMMKTPTPKRLFSFNSVTIPNKPIYPGDIAYIVDDRFGFSSAGSPVVSGQITDLNYSIGVQDAGSSSQSKGQTDLQLNVVAYNQFY